VLQPGRIRRAGDAFAAVVVRERHVVVEVYVHVRRAAVAVEVEHASGGRRRGPELDRSGLGRDSGRTLRRHQVVALVHAAGARVAEVVDVAHGADDGKTIVGRPVFAAARVGAGGTGAAAALAAAASRSNRRSAPR